MSWLCTTAYVGDTPLRRIGPMAVAAIVGRVRYGSDGISDPRAFCVVDWAAHSRHIMVEQTMNKTLANTVISRRTVRASAGAFAVGSRFAGRGASGVAAVDAMHNPLWIPLLLSGTAFDLTLAPETKQFLDGEPTATIAYNGAEFWGPTLVMKREETVSIDVQNGLDEETTTHWHGFHVPAEWAGRPHQMIAAGETWSGQEPCRDLLVPPAPARNDPDAVEPWWRRFHHHPG